MKKRYYTLVAGAIIVAGLSILWVPTQFRSKMQPEGFATPRHSFDAQMSAAATTSSSFHASATSVTMSTDDSSALLKLVNDFFNIVGPEKFGPSREPACVETNENAKVLFRARHTVLYFRNSLKGGSDEPDSTKTNNANFRLVFERSPTRLAEVFLGSRLGVVRSDVYSKYDWQPYKALAEKLLEYQATITSTPDWRSKFDNLLAAKPLFLARETAYHEAGFKQSEDTCFLEGTNWDYSLEGWFYGFWIRRYNEGTFELTESMLKWFIDFVDDGQVNTGPLAISVPVRQSEADLVDRKLNELQSKVRFDLQDWEGPVYAAYLPFLDYAGSFLVNLECEGPTKHIQEYATKWADKEFYTASYGAKPHSAYTVISNNGRLFSVESEGLACTTNNECGGSWWQIGYRQSVTSTTSEMLAVVPTGSLSPSAKTNVFESTVASKDCQAPPPVPPGFNVDNRQVDCKGFVTSVGGQKIELEVLRYWYEQENGWPYGINFVRILGSRKPGVWQELGNGPDGLLPKILLQDDVGFRILFSASEGIHGPAVETRRIALIKENELILGKSFTAGGQPCD